MEMIIDCKKKPIGEVYITSWWIGVVYPLWEVGFDSRPKEMDITCWMKEMKLFDVFEMKMVTIVRIKMNKSEFFFDRDKLPPNNKG